MTNVEALTRKLQSLPEEKREHWAALLLDRLERLEALREEIRKGDEEIERGEVVPFDAEDIIRRGQERLAAKQAK